jgi:uncharacterized protein
MRPSRTEVLRLLRELSVPEDVVCHSVKVEGQVHRLLEGLERNGIELDGDLALLGALFHDLGRSKSHSIDHGLVGARILRTDPKLDGVLTELDREALARICERHIGAGIPAADAEKVGLPPTDFMPLTLEEKIVTHADNLVVNGVLKLADSHEYYRRRFGEGSPIYRRIVELGVEIESLAGEGD